MSATAAPAKLNLYLHVLGRRDDGYHLIESGVVFTELGDQLTITPSDQLQLTMDGPFADAAGGGEGNLVLKAARALQAKTNTRHGAAITLTKNIPVGAGLGGGSSDAATALLMLNDLWQLKLTRDELKTLAPELGADVAMCIDAAPAIASGIGDVLDAMPCTLPPLHVVLAHPRVPLLTADVYKALRNEPLREAPAFAPNEASPNFEQFLHHLARTRNDLQRAAIAVSAQVTETLLALETTSPAPALVRMTGSGACCFALYAQAADAVAAAQKLQREYPEWWVVATKIR